MNETKRKIFEIVSVCLIAGLIIGGLVLTVNAENAYYGKKIGEWRGINTYSNGQCTAKFSGVYEKVNCGDSKNRIYQCVEYVKRFYKNAINIDTSKWSGNANQYYGKASGFGLKSYLNGGTVAPQADDILCFDNGGYGHVTIVTGVNNNYVYIIEQNWDRNNAYKRLRWNKNTNKVYNRGTYWIQGWLRLSNTNKGLSADLNCDNRVNIADFSILMSYWNTNGSGATSCRSPDINHNGIVDIVDYSIMMSQWTG